jgi:hypothetical protein
MGQGPRADDHNSVRRYFKQALSKRRISANGFGDELQEYVHVYGAAQLCVGVLADEFRNQHVVLTDTNQCGSLIFLNSCGARC